MYCPQCGIHNPDDANFCYKCGRPLQNSTATAPTRWEICRIGLRMLGRQGIYEAYVGDRVIASRTFDRPESGPLVWLSQRKVDEEAREEHRRNSLCRTEFLSELAADGWEPFPSTQTTVETLRRPIKP